MFSLCDAQNAVELFSGVAESGNESGLDNGVSATGDKRERDLFEKMLRPARSSGREISTALVINNPNGNITLEIFPPT